MKLLALFLASLLTVMLYAKTPAEIAEEAHIASINTLLIFTSQEGLSSGLYHFRDVGVDMEVYHLPFTYHFESDTNINFFMVGNVGYSRVFISQDVVIPPNTRLDYNNHLRTYTGGLGGGARYKLSQELSVSGGVELLYSKSGASVKKPDGDMGDVIEDFFNQNYNDNLSYEIFANIEYKPMLGEYKPYAALVYKSYETKSTFSFDELNSFRSDSTIWTLSLGVETPALMRFERNYATLEGYYHANYLSGSVEEVVKFDVYSTLGALAYLYTPDGPWWASRFFLEVSSVQSQGLEGYNVGVGFSLDY
ncbi:MAG: hypothetical protein U9N39_10760 [Campylobacterota bacterium]|nr:hypothetical protein [Campylobacterota bacterium]